MMPQVVARTNTPSAWSWASVRRERVGVYAALMMAPRHDTSDRWIFTGHGASYYGYRQQHPDWSFNLRHYRRANTTDGAWLGDIQHQ